MRYVLDASVAFKWFVPEADSAKADRLRDDFRAGVHDLLSPDIVPQELAHALTRAEREGRIPVGDALRFWADAMATPPRLFPSHSLIARAITISSSIRIGVHDCVYVALAEREGCELVTADDRLVRNVQPHFPFVRSLASLP
jgi:predicted nucleic acid-binding protein